MADVDIAEARRSSTAHHGKLATVTAVQPPGRFGALELDGERRAGFIEKPQATAAGSMAASSCFRRGVIDLIEGDDTLGSREPLMQLAARASCMAFRHAGFWQPMDTLRDKNHLEELWQSGEAPWKMWA